MWGLWCMVCLVTALLQIFYRMCKWKNWESINTWQRYGQKFVSYFFGPPYRSNNITRYWPTTVPWKVRSSQRDVTSRTAPTSTSDWLLNIFSCLPVTCRAFIKHTTQKSYSFQLLFCKWRCLDTSEFTLWRPQLPYGYSCKASCARPG